MKLQSNTLPYNVSSAPASMSSSSSLDVNLRFFDIRLHLLFCFLFGGGGAATAALCVAFPDVRDFAALESLVMSQDPRVCAAS